MAGSGRQRWVDSDGLRLAVYEWGEPDRPTVVLVHGYPDNASVWDRVAPVLAEAFHVVTYDVRGHGRSDAPATRDGYRVEALVGDLHAVVRATAGDDPAHLVGHDWGSVQAWAALEPALVRSFTSISGPDLGQVGSWVRQWRRHPAAVGKQLTRSWYIGAFQVPVLPEALWRLPGFRRRFGAEYRDAANGLQLYRASAGRGRPRRITVPVQQIVLTQDPFLTPALAAAAEEWCDDLYRRELVAGHWAPRTHPDAVARMVREFVEHVERGTSPRGRVTDLAPALAGQLALVTGAGSGIGLATAVALAGQGARVLCVDLDFERAEQAARRVGGLAFQLDVADPEATEALARHVLDEHGVPDLVMANAGIGVSGSFLDTSLEDWRRVVDVNLWGVIHTLRAFLPAMVERGEGGHVVITSSAAGYFATPSLPAYSTTKAGVLMLAQCLDGELRPAGIGVSAVCPGFVHTNIASTARFAGTGPEEEQARRERAEALYRRRNYGPEKVAAAVLAAVSEGRVVVPVTPEAHLGAWATRLVPGVARALGRRLAAETAKRTS
ncbi:SDR family oxidoreductase [Actinophytocola xanthii]|uniref:Short chain dehydrogenase n=1 Tax=Actinophytocola xanthii TaxID=1912961 RepID=A0A1Q8CWI3_9PSEU|nr:SDR family oxidoreductase [Actinophytocola xanthii]OLF18702.1 short chain dehydrogenase [Actinophytocola xanthii]